jgi:FHS family glucose/mannose:H+ symporter-like MFS transporter
VSTKSAEITPFIGGQSQSLSVLSGFLILGILLGLPGPLLIAWQYHVNVEPKTIGYHFLALNAGYLIASAIARRNTAKARARRMAALSCAAAVAGLVSLSFLAPPAWIGWRIILLTAIGASAGGLATALFYLSESFFAKTPAVAANISGLFFGCGCLIATITTGSTYFAGSFFAGPIQLETSALAVLPLVFFFIYLRGEKPWELLQMQQREEERRNNEAARDTLKDLRSIATVLFSLLLFFQFGNEWAMAGWLPLFLVHRLGTNPAWAIGGLTIYFAALMLGRLASRFLLPRINHRRLLLSSITLAMAGYSILSFATILPVALIAAMLIGAGFAPIYPLIAEQLDDRFSYHPGFYSGAISIAVIGATGAPWLLGYVDEYLGMQAVMLIPALGSCAVLLLAWLIMFEARLMGGKRRSGNQSQLIASDRM